MEQRGIHGAVSMGGVPYPKTSWLMHNRLDLLSAEQRARYDAMVRLSDLLNRAMQDDMERTTGKYLPMLFTEFLEKLYGAARALEEPGQALLIDDFIRIARFSLPALKHITAQPSTRIVKCAEKVPVSRARQTTSATMRWLAKRPGRSVEEKISPRNQVLTKVTRFSPDTRENREMAYLYKILYDVVRSRTKGAGSSPQGGDRGEEDRELQELLSLHLKIKQGELAEVPPVKQSLQNNKLMCDKHYKMVWDAVRQLSGVEEKLQKDWEQAEERYLQAGFWIVLAWLLHHTDTVIYDWRGALHDENGALWFSGGLDRESRRCAALFPLRRPDAPLTLLMQGSVLTLEDRGAGDVLMRHDFADSFGRLSGFRWERTAEEEG